MRVLVACEYSGMVRDAFSARGYDAARCDLLPSETAGVHYQCDVRDVIGKGWDLMIAHPPCTYLTASAEWAYRDQQTKAIRHGTLIGHARRMAREDAIQFVMDLASAPIHRIAIENPVGVLSTRWRKPDQFIQPYEYGDNASKRTCLWLKNLPPLIPTAFAAPRLVRSPDGRGYVMRWANQTDSGQNREPPSADRWKIRSATWAGWAEAMADQWGEYAVLREGGAA